MNLIQDIETYLADYATLSADRYRLPLALWTVGTFLFDGFTAFPYVVITSDVKRSGKTRLAELLSFACSNPRNFAAMTGPVFYRSIEAERPTIFFDEAETLSGESAGIMRSVCNVGYRKGQTIPRTVGNNIKEFNTYCPKVFILIGDVYDTLRDRSIVVRMKRAEARERFTYEVVKNRGAKLRERIDAEVKRLSVDVVRTFEEHSGLDFLTDRDEEIWTPLFVLAEHFCPERIEELKMCAVDIATEKTADKRRYVNLLKLEEEAMESEYAERLLNDLYAILTARTGHLSSQDAIEALRAVPVAPWRTFRGSGLDVREMAHMLSRFGVRPALVRIGKGRKGSKVMRGYTLKDVETARRRQQSHA